MKEKLREEKKKEKNELLRRQSSIWIDERQLEKELLDIIVSNTTPLWNITRVSLNIAIDKMKSCFFWRFYRHNMSCILIIYVTFYINVRKSYMINLYLAKHSHILAVVCRYMEKAEIPSKVFDGLQLIYDKKTREGKGSILVGYETVYRKRRFI